VLSFTVSPGLHRELGAETAMTAPSTPGMREQVRRLLPGVSRTELERRAPAETSLLHALGGAKQP
jgi:hypothetical protein